ncbi:MAG: hypothetical protein EBS47_06595 [Betaproteobacteria bacterium]|nr:hypothetical protein [Betaproteobacteria bacterium]
MVDPALDGQALAAALGVASRSSTIHPEARDMVAQSLRDQAKQSGDFQSPFDENAKERPLGEQPMLVASVDLKHHANGQVDIVWRDAQRRDLSLSLAHDLLHNLLSLMQQALQESEWGLVAPRETPSPAPDESRASPRILN